MINTFFSSHSTHSYWSLVPICAPFLGAVVGVLMYQLMIGYHLERDVHKELEKKEERAEEEEEEKETFKFAGMTTSDNAWAQWNYIISRTSSSGLYLRVEM